MFIEIHKLERQPILFKEEFEPGAIDLGEDVHQRTPLKSEGRADLVEEHHGKHKIVQDIRLQGGLATSLELPCARCLEPVVQDVERKFDLLYRPLGSRCGREGSGSNRDRGRDQLLSGRRSSAGRRAARAGSAQRSVARPVPRRLQGLVPGLRQKLECGTMLLRD